MENGNRQPDEGAGERTQGPPHKNGDLTPQQLIEQQKEAIRGIIEYCRERERQVKGFGLAALDQIAGQHNMPEEMKAQIKKFIDNPKLEFKVNFRKNENGETTD